MEQQTYTRLVFPGSFAVAMFAWLAFAFKSPLLGDKIISLVIPALVTIPAIGFFAGNIVFECVGKYSGWSKRNLRARVSQAFIAAVRSISPEDTQRLGSIDDDVIFSLFALGDGVAEERQESMPDALVVNGRRRWTTAWAAWNTGFGVVIGVLSYITFVLMRDRKDGEWFGAPLLLPAVVFLILTYVGRRARRDAFDLEYLWVYFNSNMSKFDRSERDKIRNEINNGLISSDIGDPGKGDGDTMVGKAIVIAVIWMTVGVVVYDLQYLIYQLPTDRRFLAYLTPFIAASVITCFILYVWKHKAVESASPATPSAGDDKKKDSS